MFTKLFRSLLSGACFALGLMAVVASVGIVNATGLSLLTGPQPASDLVSILNTLINNINTCCSAGGTGTISSAFDVSGVSGQVKFKGSENWAANGSVATTVTSLGPTGSHTTIQRWLTVRDDNGVLRYIPTY